MNTLESDPARGIGDNTNAAPLAEILSEETKPFRGRLDLLLVNVAASRIDGPETAAGVTTLGGMLADLRGKVELARKERAEPFDTGKAAVQRAFKADLIDHIDEAMATLRKMLDQWKRDLDAKAAAERRLREEEARRVQEEAEAAARKKEEAEAAGDPKAALKAEIEEVQARDRAEALLGNKEQIRPDPTIRTAAGSAGFSTQRVAVIKDLRKCVAWLLRVQRREFVETIMPLVSKLTRNKIDIEGVEVEEQQVTRFRK